jgi:protein-tyrosine-phosphatase
MDVLFVCSGNTCRSPIAEAILRRLVDQQGLSWEIGSAGLRAEANTAPEAVRALQRRGIQLLPRTPAQLTEQMVSGASLILCMTEEQRSILAEAMPADAARIHAWGGFVARNMGPLRLLPQLVEPGSCDSRSARYDVLDPIGGGDAVYESTATTIEALAAMTLKVLSSDA